MCCGYRDRLDALYATVDDCDELMTTSNSVPVMADKEHSRCIPNDFSFTDSARAAIVLSQHRLSLKSGVLPKLARRITSFQHGVVEI
jgi:hypothetical protein